MKKKVTIFTMCSLLCVLHSCYWLSHHEDVNCKAIGYLYVKNHTLSDAAILLIKNSEPNVSLIDRFSYDSLNIASNLSTVDTIYYDWKGSDKCDLYCTYSYGWSSFTVRAFIEDTLHLSKNIYPCDSTKQLMVDTCENCLIQFYDTLIIE